MPPVTLTPIHKPGTPKDVYAGCRVREEFDSLSDGTIDKVRITYFNEFSEWRRTETDTNADGQIDSVGLYIYDGDGKLVREEADKDVDGEADVVDIYTYNHQGLLIRRDHYTNPAGQPDWWVVWEYDSEGRLWRKSRFGDGQNETREYKYNESGDLVRVDDDFNADGRMDGGQTYSRADGLLIEMRTFLLSDSSFDRLSRFEYEKRRLVRIRSGDQSLDTYTYEPTTGWLRTWNYYLGGHVEAAAEYLYDAVGRLRAAIVTDFAGRRHRYSYQNMCTE